MGKKITKEQFLEKCKKVHGDKFDYSQIEYKKITQKGKIICKIHGPFEQSLVHHLMMSVACPSCAGMKKHDKITFIKKAVKIHGDYYDYSKVEYKNNKLPIIVICKKCKHEFNVRPDAHFNGRGCSKCSYERSSIKRLGTKEKFIELSKRFHGDRYDYDNSIYEGLHKKIKINCIEHGEFYQLGSNHISGAGCPKCVSSKGESYIIKYLTENNINYEIEKTFSDCINPITNKKLFFDFYLPDHNLIIEYDGMQHYVINKFYGDEKNYIDTKYRDLIKTKYCMLNNIFLIRIIYLDDNNMNLILKTLLN